ncbi:hypothetical protein DFR76_110185 [Nocardia pseudobrasiliensis]|uniref:Uncharacterized protein n=1 Tax=Nocardia pseudobrasiliensis TaxID=45979 RepID=A0A370HYB8_9NOCA|nr:hypothetical protein DFR76_110185 [Nocardia pseudobrasiliensis]
MAAHGLGGGSIAIGSTALTLLLFACTLTGVVVAAVPGGVARLLASLAAGQVIAHAALSAPGAHHHPAVTNSAMLAAHVVAIAAGALLIRGAELALGRVLARVRWVVVALAGWFETGPRVGMSCVVAVSAIAHRMHRSDARRRGPPGAVVRPRVNSVPA